MTLPYNLVSTLPVDVVDLIMIHADSYGVDIRQAKQLCRLPFVLRFGLPDASWAHIVVTKERGRNDWQVVVFEYNLVAHRHYLANVK